MRKAMHVAMREFSSTVLTKGFLIGVLLVPLIMVLVGAATALTSLLKGPTLVGEIAVIDRTSVVAPGVIKAFSEEGAQREQTRRANEAGEKGEAAAEMLGMDEKDAKQIKGMSQMAAAGGSGGGAPEPELTVVVLDKDADAEPIKESLKTVDISEKDPSGEPKRQRVAVAIVGPDSLKPDAQGKYGGFELYTAQRIDFQIQEHIARLIGHAVVDARLAADHRIGDAGMTAEQVREIVRDPKPAIQTMTSKGERKSSEIAAILVPLGFMMLLLTAVMFGGQYLLTAVVEEKSSRVMEVLLSAVSPAELMVGKIIGQMLVGMLILVVYSGLSIAFLIYKGQGHLLQPVNMIYIVIFFFIAFFIMASLLAAVGSAVTEMREAQTLQMPISLLMILPYAFWLPVSRAPNSPFSVALSFVPIINPFIMVIRLGGSEPIPAWQPPLGVLVGLITVVFCGWAAAKIFRIGVLMYGKPPNFKTLIQWVRMA